MLRGIAAGGERQQEAPGGGARDAGMLCRLRQGQARWVGGQDLQDAETALQRPDEIAALFHAH